MAESRGTLDALIVPVSRAFAVVGDLIAPDGGNDLLAELGYKVPGGSDLPALFSDLTNKTVALTDALNAVLAAYEDGSYQEASFLEKVLDLAKAVADIAKAAEGLSDRVNAAFAGAADFLANGQLDQLPRRLVDYLVVGYFAKEHPALLASFDLLGLTASTFVEEGTHNPDFYLVEVRWERMPWVLSQPRELFVQEYQWGTADFDATKLIERAQALLWLIGLPSRTHQILDPALPDVPGVLELEIPLVQGMIERPGEGLAGVEVGLRVQRSTPGADAGDVGLALTPYAAGSFAVAIDIAEGWKFGIDGQIDAEALRVNVRPQSVQVEAAVAIAAALGLTLLRDGSVLGPLVIFGDANGTRLQVGEVSQRVFAAASSDGVFDVGAEFALKEAALVIVASEGDGFLKMVLPSEPLIFGFDLTIGFSTARGVYFSGGAELEYTFHLDAEIGPIFINTIDLGLRLDGAGLRLIVSATGGLALGPVVAVVQEIGIQSQLELGKAGNLGNANLALSFKPPTGIGLSIDTPAVKAAGFLLIDTERGRYVGALELAVLQKFALTAIAIITTKMPDGSDGFSLLMIITVTLPVPIPLSYNFYFAGAGGLLGLNRSVDIDRLRDGLRAGSADNILFPTDIIRRIDAIIRDLEEVFPVVEGQFLVGPMAMITWSSPPLITIKLGLIIEIGSPIRIAILGVLRLALPEASDPIVDLKVAFLGTIDIGAGLLSFDAAIYDSYIGRGGFKLSFEGDIALRLSWGKQPDFVTSVGGFHPSFTPGAHLRLPQMRRITLSLLKDNPRLQLTCYFAITTNTIQFGARLTFFFAVSSFSIVGDFGFDVLFQFSPFHIDAQVYARLAVRAGDSDLLSLSLDFRLQGPTPWIAKGTASFKILFFKVSVEFEKRFGEEVHTTLPEVDVLPLVVEEFERNDNWRGELSAGAASLVNILPVTPPADTVVIDAGGMLTVSQRVLPLNTEFTLFGTSRPADAQEVVVDEMQIAGTVANTSPIFEPFAPAAFRELSDRDKLNAPAYEKRVSGVQVRGGHELRTDYVLSRPVAYEVLLSDASVDPQTTRSAPQPEPRGVFESLVPGGRIGRSPLSQKLARTREEKTVRNIGEVKDLYAVANVSDLRAIGPNGLPVDPVIDAAGRPVFPEGVLLARADAEARLNELLAGGKSAGSLEIIPEAQLAA